MTVRERILALRLMEKEERNPEYAKRLGVHISLKEKDIETEKEGRKENAD